MTKRIKQQPESSRAGAQSPSMDASLHLPAKQPTLLAASIILFALWFVFLLVTALFG